MTEPAPPHSRRRSPFLMRRLSLLTLPLIALCAWAPTAGASARQTVTFEAPRELLSGSTRAATLDQIAGLRCHPRAPARRTGATSRPSRTARPSPPASTRADPAAYPADKWDNLDGLIAAARERDIDVTLTLTGPVPKWATKGKRDNLHRAGREGVPGLRDRDGQALRRRREHVVGLERAEPAAVPAPAVQGRQAGLAEALPQALPGGREGRARHAVQRAGHDPDRRDLAARELQRRRTAGLPARDAVPGLQVPQGQVLRQAHAGRLRAPRVHHLRRPALGAAEGRRRDHRRAAAAHDGDRQGRQGRRAAEEPSGAPDGVRHPDRAGQDQRRLARAPGRVPRRSPSTSPTSTRASRRSPST